MRTYPNQVGKQSLPDSIDGLAYPGLELHCRPPAHHGLQLSLQYTYIKLLSKNLTNTNIKIILSFFNKIDPSEYDLLISTGGKLSVFNAAIAKKDKNVVYALTCFCILHTTSYWSNITRVQSTQNVKYHFANFPSAWLIHKTFHLLIRLHMMINSLNLCVAYFNLRHVFVI